MTIRTDSISFKINDKLILNEISLDINPGEIFTIVGPNGSGKTTYLRILSGDLRPTAGSIYYNEVNINNISILNRAKIRSVMTQSPQIIYDFTAKEIIEMGWISKGDSHKSELFEIALAQITKLCDLNNIINRKFNLLSGGEKRRVHFARTLIQVWNERKNNDPTYMFLDEPTSNLDLYHELKLINILKYESAQGKGILTIIHNLNLAYKFSDMIGILNHGKLVASGKPNEVFNEKILNEVFKVPISVNKEKEILTFY